MEDILATSREEYEWLKKGYEHLRKIFSIEASTNLMIRRGIDIYDNKRRIDIAPLNSLGEILEVSKYRVNSEWVMVGSGKGEWRIEGPENNYTIHQKVAKTLTNLV